MATSNLSSRIDFALREDAAFSDITTRAIPGVQKSILNAKLIAKANGVICGTQLIPLIFKKLDRRARVQIVKRDGSLVKPGQTVANVRVSAPALLAGERLMLNLVCHLSGIATLAQRYVQAVKGTSAKILDTRKTTPLWRDLEKYAVKCGGGENHRFSLGDAILVKDNHIQFLKERGLQAADVYGVDAGKSGKNKKIQFVAIEATTHREVWEAIKCRPDIILLDNMPMSRIKSSIVFIKAAREALHSSRPLIEVSGGVTLAKVRKLAELGVDRISVGALTHSAPALDLSLEVLDGNF